LESPQPTASSSPIKAPPSAPSIIGGLLLLTGKKWAAGLAEVCLAADVGGRVHLVLTGVYPFVGLAAVAIVIGTALAICFGVYIGLKWSYFR
jgi:hypothetical protein